MKNYVLWVKTRRGNLKISVLLGLSKVESGVDNSVRFDYLDSYFSPILKFLFLDFGNLFNSRILYFLTSFNSCTSRRAKIKHNLPQLYSGLFRPLILRIQHLEQVIFLTLSIDLRVWTGVSNQESTRPLSPQVGESCLRCLRVRRRTPWVEERLRKDGDGNEIRR